MTSRITAIFTAPTRHAEQIAVEAVQLKAGKGIVGDRFFGLRKTQPGQNLTLIEWETIDEFNRIFHTNIPLHATRRNMVTQDIRLNELVGKQFRIGDVLCRGIELCEPCRIMARNLAGINLPESQIISAFTHKAGIRAAVLSDGYIRIGEAVTEVS